jgi:hypothetical protein
MNLDFYNHDFFFICYPPGSGGQHFGNLISLDRNFCPVGYDDHNDYIFATNSEYDNISRKNTHLGLYNFNEIYKTKNFIKSLSLIDSDYSKSVWPIHLSFLSCFDDNDELFRSMRKKRIILFTFRTELSRNFLKLRISKMFGKNVDDDIFNFMGISELQIFYSREYIMKTFNFKDQDIYEIEISQIFDKNISHLLTDLNKSFDLSIPLMESEALHRKWLKNIIKLQIL